MIIREFCVEKFSKKTLREIDLTNSANCQVLAIQKCNESSYCYLPKADDKLSRGDIIVVIGKEKSLSRINP
jgi:trk system potassium uptake protein TrkA